MADVFDSVIGHAPVVAFLRREVAQPAHAYLFVGPSNCGKAMVARRFAAAVLCGGDDGCLRRAIGGSHPDLVVVEPEGRSSITVDQARTTVAQASRAPLVGGRKAFLFEEGGSMNDEAANALLKTLEEPSPSTLFVLVAESEDELPDTVASRCRTVVFGRVSDDEIVAGLENRGIDAGQAAQAARISGGRPGLALALATRPEVAAFRRAWLAVPGEVTARPGDAYRLADEVTAACEPLLEALRSDQKAVRASAEADGTADRGLKERQERELKRATSSLYVSGLEILAGFYRDVAAAQFGAPVRNTDVAASTLAGVLPSVALSHAERVLDTIEALNANQRPTLAFANLFADLGATG
jgi:DNA polymerase-3 subunit delta'